MVALSSVSKVASADPRAHEEQPPCVHAGARSLVQLEDCIVRGCRSFGVEVTHHAFLRATRVHVEACNVSFKEFVVNAPSVFSECTAIASPGGLPATINVKTQQYSPDNHG